MDTKESIIKIFKSSPTALKSGEIAEKSGIDKKETDKIIKKLMDENIVYSPKRCFYELKK